MAIGDDAAAAGMAVVDGATTDANTIDTEINRSRDYIAQGKGATDAATAGKVVKRDANGRAKVATPAASSDIATKGYVDSAVPNPLPINRGGTGEDTAAEARTALDVVGNDQVIVSTGGGTIANKIPRYDGSGRLAAGTPSASNHVATKGYVDSASSAAADGPTSTAYNRNAVGSGMFTVWMNSSLQFMRNTSSRRYKKNIRDWAPRNFMGLRTVIFDRRGEGAVADEVGFIAEEVLDVLPEAVVYFDGKIDGINDRPIIAALVSHVQQLTLRVQELEALRDTA